MFPALLVRQLLEDLDEIQPCLGVCEAHLDESVAQGFYSVVRAAERTLQREGCFPFEGSLKWAGNVSILGYLSGIGGRVSGVLGFVDDQRVFWSKACTGVASRGYAIQTHARCKACRDFHRDLLMKRVRTAARDEPHQNTSNSLLSTAQKVRQRNYTCLHIFSSIVFFRSSYCKVVRHVLNGCIM